MGNRSTGARLGVIVAVLLVVLGTAAAAVSLIASVGVGGDEARSERPGGSASGSGDREPFRNDEVALTIPDGWKRAKTPRSSPSAQAQVVLVADDDPRGENRSVVVGRSPTATTRVSQERRIFAAFRAQHARICRDASIWGAGITPEPGSARSKGPTRLGGRPAVDCESRVTTRGKRLRIQKVGTVREGYDVSVVGLGAGDDDYADAQRALEDVRRSFRFR